jgi:hypothetical protein
MAQAFTGVLASNGGGISHPRPIGKYIYIFISWYSTRYETQFPKTSIRFESPFKCDPL